MVVNKPKRVLLTGVAGFIGFHVARRLLELGMLVRGIDSLDGDTDIIALKRARLCAIEGRNSFTFVRADVTNFGDVSAAFSSFRPEYVIHLAAQAGVSYSLINPRAYVHHNIDGFLEILEGCHTHGVCHLVYASSSSVYGSSKDVPFTETDRADCPVSLYGATKRANELMAQSYAYLYRIPSTGVRFFTVYGPWGRPDMAPFIFTRAILEGRPIDVFNNGKVWRDFTYIDDAVEAVVRLLACPPTTGTPHRIVNVGNQTSVELDRLIAAIEAAIGRPAVRRLLPMRSGDVLATHADVSRLATLTDFAPKTTLEEGIRRFVEWYRLHYEYNLRRAATG